MFYPNADVAWLGLRVAREIGNRRRVSARRSAQRV